MYSNENTTNDGVLSFETGKLIVDKEFVNNAPTSATSLGTPFFNMTRATLQIGSGSTRSSDSQTLQFRAFPNWNPGDPVSTFANNVHTPNSRF